MQDRKMDELIKNRFKDCFDKEEMPEDSKFRVRQRLMDNVVTEKKSRLYFRRPAFTTIMCLMAVVVSGGTIIAAVPEFREGIVSSMSKLFLPKEKAVNQVYGTKYVEDFLNIVDDAKETNQFEDSQIQFELVSYVSDSKTTQVMLQYVVDESLPSAYPSLNEMCVVGPEETYIANERWINMDRHQGYLLLNLSSSTTGEYSITLKDIWWGSHYLSGEYNVTFKVNDNNRAKIHEINKDYTLDFETKGPKNITVQNASISPIACTISFKMPEGFSVNEAFDNILTYSEDNEKAPYFILENGEKIDVKGNGAFCSMWKTNGEYDSLGCSLAAEGAETTLMFLFDEPIDPLNIVGINIDGTDILIK